MDYDDDGAPISAVARIQKGYDKSFRNRLQKYFMENQRSSFLIRLFNLFIKILSCVLYCIRVSLDNGDAAAAKGDITDPDGTVYYKYIIRIRTDEFLMITQAIVAILSITETVIIFYISYKGSILRLLLNSHFLLEMITDAPLLFITILDLHSEETESKQIYVPIFFNCWLAHSIFTDMVHNTFSQRINNKNSALIKELIVLISTLVCLIFTCTCGMEHLQRGGIKHFTLFTSFYFVVVTFSTVGYGDYTPDIWPSQLFVVILIFVALIVLPSKINALMETMQERRASGRDFVQPIGSRENHVVVNITFADAEFMNDFLHEFYSHSKYMNYLVFLLAPNELDHKLKLLLKVPKWNHRVFHIRGTALSNTDLERAHISSAKACFILSSRYKETKDEADEHTVLRSWAVKDYAPHVPQFVNIFRPQSKMYLEHAEVVVCEDELKYSLLANNCITPGISTFVTLLMHTSQGAEGQRSTEEWQRNYGFHSGNEVYDIVAENSIFFKKCIGKSFLFASCNVHKRFGVCLLAVKPSTPDSKILLNPGPTYIISDQDTLYYMSLTNEEALKDFRRTSIVEPEPTHPQSLFNEIFTNFRKAWAKNDKVHDNIDRLERAFTLTSDDSNEKTVTTGVKSITREDRSDSLTQYTFRGLQRGFLKFGRMNSEMEMCEPKKDNMSLERTLFNYCDICKSDCIKNKIVKNFPTVAEYIETTVTYCHMMKERRNRCCLQLMEDCEHEMEKVRSLPKSYGWPNPIVIIAVDKTSTGLLHLITPLRAYKYSAHEIRTIVFLLDIEDEESPDDGFLDMIGSFPLIYWTRGKMTSTDNLLRAGIHHAEHIIITKESAPLEDSASIYLADSKTVIVAQKIYRMFTKVKLIAELNYPSNMRFVHFDPDDIYTKQQQHEKRERDLGSQIYFMFRLPFAEGSVFSANMLDRLLYQSYAKTYLVDLIKILLGMEPVEGSGYLTSINITEEYNQYKTYGSLYKMLCFSLASMPIGIYRTKNKFEKTVTNALQNIYATLSPTDNYFTLFNKRRRTQAFIKTRMDSLGIMHDDQVQVDQQLEVIREKDETKTFSYILINPAPDLELEIGDIVYVLQAPTQRATTSS